MHTVHIKTDMEQNMLFCNIKIINPDTGLEILKNNQPMILGKTTGIALTRIKSAEQGNRLTMSCKFKLQFGDCSYHYKMMRFAIRCEYFLPNDVNQHLLIATSAPFQVFARRSRSSKKRKIDLDDDYYCDDVLPPAEKKKKQNNFEDNSTVSLEQYQRAFEDLLAFKNRMNMDERRIAIQFALQRLLPANQYGNINGNYQFNDGAHIESYFSDLLNPVSVVPSLLEPSQACPVHEPGMMIMPDFFSEHIPAVYESSESPVDSESSVESADAGFAPIDWESMLFCA
jgi:hypothetical protein